MKYLKIISIILNVIVILAAIGTLLFFWLYIPYQNKVYQSGISYAVTQILYQVKQSGSVNLNGVELILKPQVVTPVTTPTVTPKK